MKKKTETVLGFGTSLFANKTYFLIVRRFVKTQTELGWFIQFVKTRSSCDESDNQLFCWICWSIFKRLIRSKEKYKACPYQYWSFWISTMCGTAVLQYRICLQQDLFFNELIVWSEEKVTNVEFDLLGEMLSALWVWIWIRFILWLVKMESRFDWLLEIGTCFLCN